MNAMTMQRRRVDVLQPPPKHIKCPSKACFCIILTVWQAIAVITLIVTGVIFLRPFVRIARYAEAICKVESAFYTTQYLCDCDGSGCKSMYPCLLVHVSINASDGQTWTVALYSDDRHQNRVHEQAYNGLQRCSVQACDKERIKNRMAVDRFHKQYGLPGTYEKCHYDETDPQWGAVIHVFKPGMSVFHAMFWPALALFLGSLTCAIFCHRCRAYEARKEKEDNTSSASTAAFLVEKSPPMKREVKPKEKGKAKVKAKMKLKERGLEEETKEILEKGGIFEEGTNGLSPPLKKKGNWL